MEVERIADGLWRWTAPHPDWSPDATGAGSWPRDVGCAYYEAADATVVVDPLAPPARTPSAARFWDALDLDVARRGLPVSVLVTVHWHARSAAEVRARYPQFDGTPDGVQLVALGDPHEEVDVYVEPHRALVVGDLVVGDGAGGLRVSPPSWYDRDDAERAWYAAGRGASLERLLALDAQWVLTSHWATVVADGRRALARAAARGC